MGSRSKKSIFYTVLTNVSRLLLALVLVLSGFVKAVDPKGTMYKLQEYTDAFSIDAFSNDWLLFFAIILAALEFLLGLFLLMGVYRKFVAFVVFLVFIIFTPFTLYVAISDAVADCGCFGDAIGLSNKASFFKNLFLLSLSVIVFLGRRRFVLNISAKNRWMIVLFSIFYISFLETVSLSDIPVLDFRNYAVGNNLRELVQGENDIYKAVYTFEKDGNTREFEQDSLPDESWTFVDSRSLLVAEGRKPIIGDFSILDWNNDYDITEDILADTGYVCIVVAELLEEASVGRVDKINDLYDYCLEFDLMFLAVTSSDEENIELWRKRTGAEYPVYWADNMLLRTMVRANPGMLLLKDGVIIGKWNIVNMPEAEQMFAPGFSFKKALVGALNMSGYVFWLLLLVLPIIVIVFIDLATGHKKKSAKSEAVAEDAKDEAQTENTMAKDDSVAEENIVNDNDGNLTEEVACDKENHSDK